MLFANIMDPTIRGIEEGGVDGMPFAPNGKTNHMLACKPYGTSFSVPEHLELFNFRHFQTLGGRREGGKFTLHSSVSGVNTSADTVYAAFTMKERQSRGERERSLLVCEVYLAQPCVCV